MQLKRTQISSSQKEVLEKISGNTIYLRNSFNQNQKEIAQLQEQAKQNAFIYLQRNKLGQTLSIFEENNLFASVLDIQKKLNLKKLPRHIECYDISHISGKFVYGSMVTFIDGRPSRKMYKLFKTKEQNNDFENHKEVLKRRLQKALDFETNPSNTLNPWKLPNLIIVDGGKGQLSGNVEILKHFKSEFEKLNLIFDVEICAIAKREEEIFLPKQQGAVIVEGQTKLLIQRIRDEAHRFAITNNRNARLKTAKKSQLDDIKGVGEKTKEKLLQTFGSTEAIVNALYKNPELVYELVGKNIVEKLKNHFGVI